MPYFIILFSNNNNVHHYIQRFNLLQSVLHWFGGPGSGGLGVGLGVGHTPQEFVSNTIILQIIISLNLWGHVYIYTW